MTNTGQNPYASVDEVTIGKWMASLDLASGTKETYLSGFKAFCWFVRSTSLDFDELTRDDVKSFKEYLVNEKKLKPATVSSYLASVCSFYAYSEDNGIENIAHRVKGVTDSRSFKKEPLTLDQAQRLLASIDRGTEKGMRDFAILNLMLRTGLRDIEIVRANCKDIQTKAGVDVLYVQGKGRASKDNFVVLTPKALSPSQHIWKSGATLTSSTRFSHPRPPGMLERGSPSVQSPASPRARSGRLESTTSVTPPIPYAIL